MYTQGILKRVINDLAYFNDDHFKGNWDIEKNGSDGHQNDLKVPGF